MLMRPLGTALEGDGPAPEGPFANWSSSIYQMEEAAAVEAGFALGSVRASSNYRVLVIDVARTAVRRDKGKRRTQTWGYGYRLVIEVSDFTAAGSLTLPAIAAAVELGQVQASVRLDVRGFNGDGLWGVLPAPQPLDVNTYKDFIDTAEKVQQSFAEQPQAAVPVLLAEADLSLLAEGGVSESEVREAVVLVGLLRRAADRVPQPDAVSSLTGLSDLPSDVVSSLGEGVYRLIGTHDDGTPTPEGASLASALLDPVRESR